MLHPYNFLVLDEPTNHLDIESKEVLKNALIDYDGTLVIVSHDRDFMEGITNQVYELTAKGVKHYPGSIKEFLHNKEAENIALYEHVASVKETSKDVNHTKETTGNNYEQRKQLEREQRKLSKEIAKIEQQIGKLENSIEEMEQAISKGETSFNGEPIYQVYELAQKDLKTLMKQWEELH